LLPLGLFMDNQYRKILIENNRRTVNNELHQYAVSLTNVLNNRFALLKALEAFVKEKGEAELNSTSFKDFASGLYSGSSGLRNFIIAPDGVNKYIYPLEGNEEALGHNLLNDMRPEVVEDVERAIRTGEPAISGPYELRQGGQGVVLRKAIFEESEFWGLVTMVLDMQPIYEFVGLTEDELLFNIALSREQDTFFGDAAVLESDPVLSTIELPEGDFDIAAVPEGGWYEQIKDRHNTFRAIALLIGLLLSVLIYLLTYRNYKVGVLVGKRTKDLREANLLLQEQEELIKQEREKARYQALHDQLTGLYNRWYFESEVTRLNKSRRLPISILVADMDSLKFINDNYGHQVGDEFIKKMGEILANSIREEDILARIGGDEFSLILPETDEETARQLCTRVKNSCEEFNDQNALPAPLKVSLGAAVKTTEDEDLYDVFNQADKRMYANKIESRRP
ncbi:MAG: diguanylate cyclase domain-containing protein, partial [Bacillota bacterium]